MNNAIVDDSSDKNKPLSAILGELERLRAFKQEVERTLFAKWKPVDRLTEIFFCVESFDTPPTTPVATSGRKIAKALHVSPTTASNSVKRLGAGDLVECHNVKHWFDRDGNAVDSRKVDLSAVVMGSNGKPKLDKHGRRIPLYHVESESFYYVKPLPAELPALQATTRDESTTAREKRKREHMKELESLVCPNCLAEGKWHAKCLCCGAKFTSEQNGATYQSTPDESFVTPCNVDIAPPDETFATPADCSKVDAYTDTDTTRQALTPPP